MRKYTHPMYSYVTVVEIPWSEVDKLDLCICKQPKERLGDFYKRQERKPDVLINAGFFSMSDGSTCFNMIDDGTVYSSNQKYRWGFGIDKDHKKFMYGSLDSMNGKFADFLSGYPVLIDNGKSCAPWTFATEINYKATRSIAAYNDYNLYFFSIGKPGLAFNDMVKMMLNIKIKYAINMDGGGSARLLIGGEVANVPTEDRAVDSVMAVYLTDEAHNKYFNVVSNYYTYTVKSGDSWWKIAANELGNGALYTKLKVYNNWGNKTLNPGDVIKIPNDKFQEKPKEDTILDCTVKYNQTKNLLSFLDPDGKEIHTITIP